MEVDVIHIHFNIQRGRSFCGRDAGLRGTLGEGSQDHPVRLLQLFPEHPQVHQPSTAPGSFTLRRQTRGHDRAHGLYLLWPGK